MTASWWFLGVAVYGALFTVNAYRPLRRFPPAVGVVFFAHWLTVELAAYHLVGQMIGTVVFARLGAFDAWPGWVGLGITLLSWAGLTGLVRSARGVETEMEEALVDALGPDYRDAVESGSGPDGRGRLAGSRTARPFSFRHRDVHRVTDLHYGPHGRRNLLDVWHHRQPTERAPVLLWIHGGAWMVGHKSQQALPMLTHMTASGWVCVSINYRLAPRGRWPDFLVDVKRAIAWVRGHVADYGGDPGFIAVSGGSAGGHLAALAALTAGDPSFQPGFEAADTSVQAAIPFYGIYDLTNRFGSRRPFEARGFRRFIERRVMGVPLAGHEPEWAAASPVDCVRPDAPPFLVIHGNHDVLAPVGDARAFVRLLREVSRAPVAYAELRGAQHAFEVFHSVRTTHVVRAVERFAVCVWRRAHSLNDGRDAVRTPSGG